MKVRKVLWITLAMAVGLIALAAGLRGPYARLAAEHWRRQLATVSDDRAGILLGQVADLGAAGIPVLVDALGCDRENVARTTREVLLQQLRRWQNLDAADSVERQAILADALADRVPQFGPAARSVAAELAGEILLWLPDSAAVDRSRIIACCEKVVRAGEGGPSPFSPDATLGRVGLRGKSAEIAPDLSDVEPTGDQVGRDGAPPQQLPLRTGSLPDQPWRRGELLRPEISVAELTPFPGGGLPIDSLLSSTPGPSDKSAETTPAGDVPATQPQLLARPVGARPVGSLPPRMLSVFPDRAQGSAETKIPAQQMEGAGAIRPLSASDAPAAAKDTVKPSSRAELAAAETGALMRQLRAKDKSQAAEARAELLRRGFGQVHLDLAFRLFDPDPQTRMELARLLPGLQSVDAAAWLPWLARDEDPEVRLVAITLMATTRDPAVWEQIEKMAREDPDPRIQQRAERLGRQRSERLR